MGATTTWEGRTAIYGPDRAALRAILNERPASKRPSRPRGPVLASFYDPPTPEAKACAARCGSTIPRDTWERAVYVALADLGHRRSAEAAAARLGATVTLVRTLHKALRARGAFLKGPRVVAERADDDRDYEAAERRAEESAAYKAGVEERLRQVRAEKFAGMHSDVRGDDETRSWQRRRRAAV